MPITRYDKEFILSEYGQKVIEQLPSIIRIKNLTFKELREIYSKSNSILIEKETTVELRASPNDIFYGDQWSLQAIELEQVWNKNTGGLTSDGQEIVIAIVDRGFDIDHSDLENNFWYNRTEIPNDNIDNDENGYVDDYYGFNVYEKNDAHIAHFHGTGVSGIIGAEGNNQKGISGINWNISMMPVSTSNPEGILTSELYEMYEYIIQSRKEYNESNGSRGAFVVAVNASLGVTGANPADYPIWCRYMERFGELGILYIGSTTNEYWDVDQEYDMPVSCASPHIIAVTNSNMADQKPEDAGFGMISIDLAAPGERIFTARLQNQYGTLSGTSSSSPHVSGLIGLMYAYDCPEFMDQATAFPQETALILKDLILKGVDKNSQLRQYTVSGGRLNAKNTFELLENVFCNESLSEDVKLNIYPTLSANQITLDYSTPKEDSPIIRIYDMAGKELYSESGLPGQRKKILLLNNLIGYSGIYLVTLQALDNIETRKILYFP